ncbi:hypothetical protein H6P81_016060 [Aristolochia fimbriata]|uniref:Uncharacterized protein n=1 Tax=Aristolochia fimbriata TaxID=158543 RepID=A0AAV7E785_ARIFI|nr:hypothetical protein H6P81_016060 [Aristolochia fimbriata]
MSSAGSARPRRSLEQKEGQCPPPTNGIKHWAEITLREHPQGPSQCFVLIKRSDSPCPVPVLKSAVRRRKAPKGRSRSVPRPARDDALAAGAARAVHRQPTGSGLGPPCPALRANPFPEAWAALGPPDFQGPPGAHRTPRDVRCSSSRWTLPPAEPFPGTRTPGSSYPEGNFGGNQLLDGSISLSPLYPSQTNDLHVSIAAGLHQSFLGRPPGIVHHLWSRQPARGSRQSASFAPYGFGRPPTSHTCRDSLVRVSRRVEWEPAGRRQEAPRGATRARPGGRFATLLGPRDDVSAGGIIRRAWVARDQRRSAPEVEAADRLAVPRSDRGASPGPIRFPPDNFKQSLTLFSKSFSSFPRGTCSLSVSRPLFSLGRNLPPYLGCIPKQPDFADNASRSRRGPGTTGAVTLSAPHSMGLAPVRRRGRLRFYNSNGESRRFSSWALPGSPPVTRGILGLRSGGNCRQGSSSEPGPRTRLRATQGQGGRSHHSSCRSALGAKCFSANLARGGKDDQSARPRRPAAPPAVGQQGTGWGENTSGVTPRQPKYPLPSRVRLPCSRSDAKATPAWDRLRASSLNSTSRPVVVRVFASRTVAGADAETRRAPVANALARGFDGRLAPAAPVAQRGIVVQLVKLGRASFRGIDNDPSAGSPHGNLVTTSPSSK